MSLQFANHTLRSATLLLALATLMGSFASTTSAQELRKTLNDFRRGPFQYQPSDPFVRSKAHQIQTKHYGLFYNCDNEECKRNSPYICWKNQLHKNLPTPMTALQRIRHELDQVRQRVYDGAGMCAGGNCGCQTCTQSAPAQGCQCATCQQEAMMMSKASRPQLDQPTANTRVARRTKLSQDQTRQAQMNRAPRANAAKTTSATSEKVADQSSLLDRYRKMRR